MNKCVCCEMETHGTYGNRFPICFECYSSGTLLRLFYQLISRQTIRMSNSLNDNLDEVNNAAEEWLFNYQEVVNEVVHV